MVNSVIEELVDMLVSKFTSLPCCDLKRIKLEGRIDVMFKLCKLAFIRAAGRAKTGKFIAPDFSTSGLLDGKLLKVAAATGFDFGGSIGTKRDPDMGEEVLKGFSVSVMP